jgi:membrane protease YdiL (CAAX protease family)
VSPQEHAEEPVVGDWSLPRAKPPSLDRRIVALIEVILCSDYPTQILVGLALASAGYNATDDAGRLTIGYVLWLSLIDTALLIGLILLFLRVHGESPAQVFWGHRPILDEAMQGLPLTLVAIVLATSVLLIIQLVAPSLHTVEHNPLQEVIGTPGDAALFAVVVVIAGGVREEIQRAFLLHRFETRLGGPVVGVLVSSAAFGAGHLVQGVDAALATGMLGVFWAVIYIRRRSAAAPMVSHSGFNLFQLIQFLTLGR